MDIEKWQHCDYRVNDPLENIPYDLTISEFKRYCEPVNPSAFIIAPGGEYRKPTGGCRLIQTIASSRAFNRYRGLYTMPTLDDMVQEAYVGMLLYKDDFTGEPKEVIFKAIRKHFKKLYRETTSTARDLDNGRHNARIAPKPARPKLLIDELDYDPAREPESVKLASGIRKWRIGGISKEYYNRSIIHFYDEIVDNNIKLQPKRLPMQSVTIDNYPCAALWPEDIRPGAPYKLDSKYPVPVTYDVDPHDDSFKETTDNNKYLLVGGKWYKRTQTKAATWKLKIESDRPSLDQELKVKLGIIKPITRKRNDLLELTSLLHAGFFPDYKLPEPKKIFLPPGAISYKRFADTNYIDGRVDLIAMLQEALYIINTMQQQQACIMKLYYYQGLTQGDISALLHKSTRKVQLAREAAIQSIEQQFNAKYHLDINSVLLNVRKLILNREILPL